MTTGLQTWSGSHAFKARGVIAPTSVAELQAAVAAGARLRALGTRHSFSDIADTRGLLVTLDQLDQEPELTAENRVSVPAALRYGDLAVWLQERGRALANLASLPHISVAGAVATGTHGSGVGNGSLATAVTALDLVDGRGELVRLERGGPDFDGAVVALGALGVVTRLELETEPTFDVRQVVHEGISWPDLLDGIQDILRLAYSVSVFTRWNDDPEYDAAQIWVKSRADEPLPDVLGARPAPTQRHMIPGQDPSLTTPQGGVAGPWFERLPHFRLGFQPSAGDELQSEYLLPLSRARAAMEAVLALGAEITPLLHVSEIRTVAADQLWLSEAHDTDSVALHFTWHRDPVNVRAVLPRLEEALLPLGARPHWGKVFAAKAEVLAPRYPRWKDFQSLAARFDPKGTFGNDWLARVGLGERRLSAR